MDYLPIESTNYHTHTIIIVRLVPALLVSEPVPNIYAPIRFKTQNHRFALRFHRAHEKKPIQFIGRGPLICGFLGIELKIRAYGILGGFRK